MTDSAPTVDGAAATTAPGSAPSAVHSPVVRRYAAGVALLAVALTVGTLAVAPELGGTTAWTVGLPLLVVALLATEVGAPSVEFRKGAVAIPLTEVPLAAALLLVPAPAALLACVLALGVRAVHLRQHWLIALFNVAAGVVEVAAAFLVFDLLRQQGVLDLLAVFCGLLVAGVVGGANSLGLALAISGRRGGDDQVHLATTTTTITVVVPVMVVVSIQLLRSGLPGWTLLTAVVVAFAALYRAYSVLLRERKDVALVQEISRAVAEPGDVWPRITDLIGEQFNARRTVVHAPDGGISLSGDLFPEGHGATGALGAERRPGAGLEAYRVTTTSADPEVQQALRARGASDVVVAPLGTGSGAGSIELHDRQHLRRGFTPSDVALLGTLAQHIATAVDNRRLLGELRDAAYHDRLTGLSNRLGFFEQVDVVITRPVEPGSGTAAIMVVELGAIGQVNDALGHGWGDQLVVQAAERVRAAVGRLGSGTIVARVEGDTFCVFVPAVAAEGAEQLAAELAVELGAPYPVGELAVEAAPAIGVAVLVPQPGARLEAEELIQHADVAMQAARTAGQPVRTYHAGMGQGFLRRFQLVTQFRAALDSGQVRVHYQPKVSLGGRTVVGAEALMRWTHPEFGAVDPEELVRVLEATGLMDELTRFVLDDALLRCRRLLDRGLRIDPAVNVSVRNLLSPQFPAMVLAALAKHGVAPEMLTLEITETSVMGDAERTLPALRVLHDMGVSLSVDDFGTGYSSLSYLRRLPVDEVKIDKSFVLGMGTDLGDLAVVRAIIDLGRSLGLRVVAEGVETDVVRDQLAEMGCDVAQGYLYSRALDPVRFDAWLHTRTAARSAGSEHEVVSPRLAV